MSEHYTKLSQEPYHDNTHKIGILQLWLWIYKTNDLLNHSTIPLAFKFLPY